MLKRTSGDFLKTKSSSDGFVFLCVAVTSSPLRLLGLNINPVVRQYFVNYLRLIVDSVLVYLD